MSAAVAFTPESKKKPFIHVMITDLIIFLPALAIPLSIIDLIKHPPVGLTHWLEYIATALFFAIFGAKVRNLGISLGYHRQGTHPSYQTYPWLKAIFFACGSSTAQGRMVNWLSDHWHHHMHSDEDEDLHSPLHGFWHAYVGWLRGLMFDRTTFPQFANDKMIMFFSNTFFVWLVLGLLIPAVIGQLTGFGAYRGLLFGGAIGMFLANYVTYWVNAGCHKFGKRDFNTTDVSTNFWLDGFWGHKLSWFFAYLSWGETNHNNHHAIANSANHGMFKGQFDPSANLLHILERMNLVWNVQWTSEEEARERQANLLLSVEDRKKLALEKHRQKQEEKKKELMDDESSKTPVLR